MSPAAGMTVSPVAVVDPEHVRLVPGTIVSIRMRNFMQYGPEEVHFRPGPNLNVIVGPNGAGKSTIVNAICLGLAGKTGTLGRASQLADFIKVGEEEAEIEIELSRGGGHSREVMMEFRIDHSVHSILGARFRAATLGRRCTS